MAQEPTRTKLYEHGTESMVCEMYNEEIIYLILEYIRKRNEAWAERANSERPVQEPWSRWAVDEIIGELKLDQTSYPDEIVRRFIQRMAKYAEVAEPERRVLYVTAQHTAEDLYSYLFGEGNQNRKEKLPF